MPTYDYNCLKCGKTFEYWQSMKDDALVLCPSEVCENETKGSGTVQRVISGGTGVIYKGEGFYLTDYTSKKKSEDRGASSESSTESTTSSTTKSTTESTTKSDTESTTKSDTKSDTK